ncbi:hypothetical protein [Indiicoccus explosivorum]|uniref:hypothetical protein n=1 Tax=Indiicoccus explosivorum TaxID=1917864 RepID=UPI00138FE57F|nr:hypothetical protein [Indiicoccus explosivorum]
MVFPVVIGILLRLPTFLLEVKEKKITSFDWSKFIAVGVPAFVLLVMLFLPFLPPLGGSAIVRTIAAFSVSTVPTITGIVFGYVLLDSFRTKET